LDRLGKINENEIRKYFTKNLSERSVINYGIDLIMAKEYKKIAEFYAGNQD